MAILLSKKLKNKIQFLNSSQQGFSEPPRPPTLSVVLFVIFEVHD
eukprot:UN25670